MARMLGRLSYANVMATLAVFIALGGGAYAVGVARDSVGTKQLKDDAVISAKVENGSLKANDFDKDQLPAGPPGATGPQGVQGLQGPRANRVFRVNRAFRACRASPARRGHTGSCRHRGSSRDPRTSSARTSRAAVGSPASVSTPRSKRARPLSSRRSTSPRPPPATARAWVMPNPTARGAAAETHRGADRPVRGRFGGQQRRHRQSNRRLGRLQPAAVLLRRPVTGT